MANIKQITILDSTRLRLDQDAHQGDVIDLLDINQVDTQMIIKKIDEAKDLEYQRRIHEVKTAFEQEKKIAISEALSILSEQNVILQERSKTIEQRVKDTLTQNFLLEKQALEHQMNTLKDKQTSAIKDIQFEYQQHITSLKQNIEAFELIKEQEIAKAISHLEKEKQSLEHMISDKEKELAYRLELVKQQQTLEKQALEKEYLDIIRKKDEQLSTLQLTKSLMNVKQLGEGLENWCHNEYMHYALSGFDTCTWEKDNKAVKDEFDIKGTKADYIFKVYASTDKKADELITSVACEMKSEDPTSNKKTRNADHYKKLDTDRTKKNCEYALLISELEWDQSNDSPIRKVFEYEKMYVVRPQYFVTFLSLITALGLKYQSLIIEEAKMREEFKDTEAIIQEFEELKNNILDNSLRHLENEVKDILTNAEAIQALSKKISDAASTIIEKRLDLIRRKIEGFAITKISKKIDKIS